MAANLISLESGVSDQEFAHDATTRLRKKLEEACAIMDEANGRGMRINFNCGIDGFGRNVVASIEIMKRMI